MQEKSKNSFKRMIKIKSKEYTLNYLLDLSDRHEKMENLVYTDLMMQNYLNDSEIPVKEAKNLFRFRTRSARFKENMKNSYNVRTCPLCCLQLDTQAHSLQCPEVKSKITVEGNYKDIFSQNIPRNISKTLMRITELRKEFF